jgi:hypothetical protein
LQRFCRFREAALVNDRQKNPDLIEGKSVHDLIHISRRYKLSRFFERLPVLTSSPCLP